MSIPNSSFSKEINSIEFRRASQFMTTSKNGKVRERKKEREYKSKKKEQRTVGVYS